MGSVTDSGSDVKRCCKADDRLGLKWEWCGLHMLNPALVEGVGCSEAAGALRMAGGEDTTNGGGGGGRKTTKKK